MLRGRIYIGICDFDKFATRYTGYRVSEGLFGEFIVVKLRKDIAKEDPKA
jgi:hypothetical protein